MIETNEATMTLPEMKLENVPVPVSDVDRAKAFYEQAGFRLDVDIRPTDTMRVVHFTPPGSACSIVFGTGMGEITDMTPGSVKGLHLVVDDINTARSALVKRGIAVGEITDLSGVKYAGFSDPDGNLWLLQEFPPEVRQPGQSFYDFNDEAMLYKREELFSSDVQLLGRVTYEGFAKAWPTMPDTGDFGERMNSMPKYVVSTTLTHAEWQTTTIISKNVVEEIQKLKEQAGQHILVAGSGKLVQTLMNHDLVDEFRFMVHPVVLGSVKRLFTEGTEQCKLTLVETKSFKTGIVVLHYQPV